MSLLPNAGIPPATNPIKAQMMTPTMMFSFLVSGRIVTLKRGQEDLQDEGADRLKAILEHFDLVLRENTQPITHAHARIRIGSLI